MPAERALRIGIGGPVGSGKSSLVAALCRSLGDELRIGVVTNDIYTTEDALFLRRTGVLPPERILAVETGGCPHTAIRDDVSANLEAVAELERGQGPLDLVLVESGGDNLTAIFSPALADVQIFVIDVAGGDDIPRKGGPGITRSDLLVVNKEDLAELVGSDLERMRTDARDKRGARPVQFLSLRLDPLARPVADWVREQVDAAPRRRARHRRRRPRTTMATATATTTGTTSSHAGALRLRVERRGGRSVVTHAEGHVPYAARVVPGREGWARVVLVQTIAGPLAGDRAAIEVEVGPGAALEVVGERGDARVPVRRAGRATTCGCGVGEGARLAWLPQPLILAAGCDLDASLELELAAGAAARHARARRARPPRRGARPLPLAAALRARRRAAAPRRGRACPRGTPVDLDGAGAYGSLALLGLEPEPADPDELALAGPGRVLRALAPDAAPVHARLAATEAAWLDCLAR